VLELIEATKKAGAIGATQNMLGEAVHALVTVDKVEAVSETFMKFLPAEKVIISGIDCEGARLTG
jgi:hypothetical protein